MLKKKLHNEQERFIINVAISSFIRSKGYYALANLSIALKKYEMLQSTLINQMDNGSIGLVGKSKLGLEGVSSLFKGIGCLKFVIKALKHEGLRSVHS
jgi:hypothetical protein